MLGVADVRRTPRRQSAIAACAATLALLALALAPSAARGAPEAVVRVDQLGYPNEGSKRAYLMSSVPEAGAPFVVARTSGPIVYTGTVAEPSAAWNAAFPYVYALDFDPVTAPGTYRVRVGPSASPAFRIASPQSLYSPALANALYFYENERDGPEYVPSALRTAPAHLNDARAMTYLTPKVNVNGGFVREPESLGRRMDASGGWWDAGDYLKFVQTTSYAVDVMLSGVRDFPAAMRARHGADFTDEARFGVEWLMKMWNERTRTLYYQVGIGEGNHSTVGDHDIWRLPQADDTYGGSDPRDRFIRNRPVFRAGPPGAPISPNLAGRLAAAFALCYQDFRESEPGLAGRCLLDGESIFALANTEPQGRLLTVIPFSFYPEREWRDDLELGAGELALALEHAGPLPRGLPHREPAYYVAQAATWAKAYLRRGPSVSEGLNLYDVSGLADYDLVRAMRAGADERGLAAGEAETLGGLRAKLVQAGEQAAGDPFGFGFPWAQSDTASHGDGLAVMAAEYDSLTGTHEYAGEQIGWLGNVLGANPWGVSMIVGDGSVFPDCLQHQVANLAGSLAGGSPVLAGAVVEGPTDEPSSGEVEGMRRCEEGPGREYARFDGQGSLFEDNVQAFTSTEPAIDLTATSMLAFAWETVSGALR